MVWSFVHFSKVLGQDADVWEMVSNFAVVDVCFCFLGFRNWTYTPVPSPSFSSFILSSVPRSHGWDSLHDGIRAVHCGR